MKKELHNFIIENSLYLIDIGFRIEFLDNKRIEIRNDKYIEWESIKYDVAQLLDLIKNKYGISCERSISGYTYHLFGINSRRLIQTKNTENELESLGFDRDMCFHMDLNFGKISYFIFDIK